MRKSSGLVLSFVLLMPGLLAPATPLHEFNSECSASERKAVLRPTDPAYSYAVDLARLLAGRGIRVDCICASKAQRLFEGQIGAAHFHTEVGIFDSLFLPAGQVFRVEVVEKAENGCDIYSFRGSPAGRPMEGCGRPMFIIQHRNVLLLVTGDQPLAERLEKTWNSR